MAKVLLDMAMSLDGYVAGLHGEDQGLYDWYFEPQGANVDIVDELVRETGAIVMGRNTYGAGEDASGFDDTPYAVPHFVVTHRPPVGAASGAVDFRFVTDGVYSAISQAQSAADHRWVAIGGGPDIAAQSLAAGLVDEIQLHVVPTLAGSGIRLFDSPRSRLDLDCIRVIEAPGATHLRYRVSAG
jgi:dihydrofolate reductase